MRCRKLHLMLQNERGLSGALRVRVWKMVGKYPDCVRTVTEIAMTSMTANVFIGIHMLLTSEHLTTKSVNPTEARRGRGRPKSDNPRNSLFVVRLSSAEMEAIIEKARAAKKVRAEWVRETILA